MKKVMAIGLVLIIGLLPHVNAYYVEGLTLINSSELEEELFQALVERVDHDLAMLRQEYQLDVNIAVLEHVKQEVLLRFRQLGYLMHLVLKYGAKPTAIAGIIEVSTSIIIPSILLPMGFGALIPYFLPPYGVGIGIGVGIYETAKFKYQLSKEMHMSTRELDKLKRDIIGYDLKYRITDVLYQRATDVINQYPLDIVTKIKKGSNLVGRGMVTIETLETIVASEGRWGRYFLAKSKADSYDTKVYAVKLFRFITCNADLYQQLNEKIVGNISLDVDNKIRNWLINLDKFKQRRDDLVVKMRGLLKKLKKNSDNNAESIKQVKAQIELLDEMRYQLIRTEYKFLLNVHINGGANLPQIMAEAQSNSPALAQFSEQFKEIEADVAKMNRAFIDIANSERRLINGTLFSSPKSLVPACTMLF